MLFSTELGLTVVRECTVFSDTICTCIEGFHCLDPSSSGCKTCQKHRSCSPGQYIRKKEYYIEGQCCPMCQAGTRVYRHCTQDLSTSCIPCMESTYTEKPNGLDRCYGCKLCDSELGLTVVQECTVFSDTICTCIEGFYCLDPSSSGCKACQKHRSCSPGQYIRKKEFSVDRQCCPMCSAGSSVYKPCTHDSSTSCIPCERGTYTEEPNGLLKCFPCKNCDQALGLTVRHECQRHKNTICGPLTGYFCSGKARGGGCDQGQKHTVCKAGQRVQSQGTAESDTRCEGCPEGTFSTQNMSLDCTPWTE
ncbi:TNR5 factor, partial [Polyodon spathula]|nr:TNR5 factor [Polyodon spathula]